MVAQTETKHDRFLRIMTKRLQRTLNELRMVGQLASANYENTPEEAEEVVKHLDESVRDIAEKFDVEYVTRVGKAASNGTSGSKPMGPAIRKVSILDEVEIMKTLEHLRAGRIEEVDRILRSAIVGKSS